MRASSPVIGGVAAYLFAEQGISTSTIVAANVNPVNIAKMVTFTASVTANPSSSTIPAGSVSFFDGSTFLGNVVLDNTAQAAFASGSLAAGVHSINGAYLPSASSGFAASTSAALTETVNAPLDFTIGAATGGSTSATVKSGQTAMYSLQLSLVGGAATDQLMVTVTCTGAPAKATCTGPGSTVPVTQAGPTLVAISVSTMTNGMLIPPAPSSRLRTPWNRLPIVWVLPMLLILLWLRRCKQTEARAWAAKPAFAVPVLLLAMAGAAASGCGGGGSTTTPLPVNSGTPTGTYTLTVTVATPSNLTHSQQLTLVVQ